MKIKTMIFEYLASVLATSERRASSAEAGKKRESTARLSSLSQRRPRKSRTRKETPQDVGIIHIIGRPLLRRSSALPVSTTASRKADSRVSAFPAWMKCNLSLLKYPYFHSSHIRVHTTLSSTWGLDRHRGTNKPTLSLKSPMSFRFNIARMIFSFRRNASREMSQVFE